jgi:hypothetical protein
MNVSFDDPAVQKVFIRVCTRYKAPVEFYENREFFSDLASQYQGAYDLEEFEKWLDLQIPKLFIAFGKRPEWIQGEEWPFSSDNKPMVFIGQIDISLKDNPESAKFFHDDTSFYVFIAQEGSEREIIVQVY